MKILVVDDNRTNLLMLNRLVEQVEGCEAVAFTDPAAGLEHAAREGCDIALVDYVMPGIDGVTFIQRLRSLPATAGVPAVMITGEGEQALRRSALDVGATDFLQKPIDPIEFKARLRNLMALRRAHREQQSRAEELTRAVAAATRIIAEREEELILRLARATEMRDGDTGAHIDRIAHYSRILAEAMDRPAEEVHEIFLSSPMHDIGKISVPDAILLKPGRLTEDERRVMERHTLDGYRILEGSKVPLLQMAAEIALGHHERYDGGGYPRRVAGAAIPLAARIVAVADVFDALTSARPYKPAWSVADAVEHVRAERGRHFDPACVDAFLSRLPEIVAVRDALQPLGAVA